MGRRGGVCLTSQETMYYTTGIDEANMRLTEHWMYSPALGLANPTFGQQLPIGSFDLLGRPTEHSENQVILDFYSNGMVKKRFQWVP